MKISNQCLFVNTTDRLTLKQRETDKSTLAPGRLVAVVELTNQRERVFDNFILAAVRKLHEGINHKSVPLAQRIVCSVEEFKKMSKKVCVVKGFTPVSLEKKKGRSKMIAGNYSVKIHY